MKFHKSCKTISIYSFNEILKTKDFRHMVIDYDEFKDEELKLGPGQLAEAKEIHKDLIYEYSELTANPKILSRYKEELVILGLEFRHNTTVKILNYYLLDEEGIEVLELLNKVGWVFNKDGNINAQIDEIARGVRGIKTRIKVLKGKFKDKYGISDNDDNKTFIDKLDREAISLEMALKLSYSINTKEITVAKWISMWNIANERATAIKARSRHGKGKNRH